MEQTRKARILSDRGCIYQKKWAHVIAGIGCSKQLIFTPFLFLKCRLVFALTMLHNLFIYIKLLTIGKKEHTFVNYDSIRIRVFHSCFNDVAF